MKNIIIISVAFIALLGGFSVSPAQMISTGRSDWLPGVTVKFERMRDDAAEDIRKIDANMKTIETTIVKSGNLIRLAQEKGNAQAETIAQQALKKAQESKIRNMDNRKSAERNKIRAEEALAVVKAGGKDLESRLEQLEFQNMNADWTAKQKRIIEERLREPNRYAGEISRSLKTKAPPPLPNRKYDELQPGDVLLISPEEKSFWNTIRDSSAWIAAGDSVSSNVLSPASHTVLYLKEVNGKKLFLDHTSERGSHVIGEEEFLKTYGQRGALVASPKIDVGQPAKEAETAAIWEHTKELVKKEQDKQAQRVESRTDAFRDLSGYGLYGDGNMVCSEADRWVLVNSGRKIPETASPLKRLLGIHYGPANFFSDQNNFIITPLYGVPN
jgi:hypothetical protein